ncbi:DNA-binding transcriptional regulator, LysR family [Desulfonispora thiosulfatigenes DSM 11270]|uniref:DNA-binding transcriptional regulator, LysR family n=1 Tax=Desulfonispora thiosulfatigenes DSM 11270 TaxID=656914 RepID=A0A1W1VIY0_DESTI|nr:selenium metabolism-associated LysR family transcriptional regulator [Desulfonispora thiosulfatigenes]SMB93286.1 DNA-binding transcriptional regulator, LysR family [Desulfonispora thiosulfatigenes DSM 11270]
MINDSLKVFMQVVDKNSFSKAAKALSLTQPAVSFQIHTLEQYYGTVLFDRVNRNISLTVAGELLLKYAKKMIQLQSEIENSIEDLTGTIKGKLVVGGSTTVGEFILPPLVGNFKKKFTQVDIRLCINNSKETERMVLNDIIDIGIIEGPASSEDLIKEKFIDDELVLVTSTNHPWASIDDISVFKLKDYPFICREKGSGTRHVIESTLKEVGFPLENLNVAMELGSTSAITAAVKNDLGMSIISKWAAREMVEEGLLSTTKLDETKFTRQFTIIMKKDKFRTHAIEEFLGFLNTDKLKRIAKD